MHCWATAATHNVSFIQTKSNAKGCFPFFTFCDAHLVKSGNDIQLGVPLNLGDIPEDFGD
jgi:hypothetical protein